MNRKSAVIVRVLCAAVGVFAIARASAQNLLTNQDFESSALGGNGLYNWQVNGAGAGAVATLVTPDNGPTCAGSHSAILSNSVGASNLNIVQVTGPGTIVPGATLSWSVDAKFDNFNAGGVAFIQFLAIGTGGVGVVNQQLNGPYTSANGIWQPLTGTFVPAAGADHLEVSLQAATGAAAGVLAVAQFDNILVCGGGAGCSCSSTNGGGGSVTNTVQATIAQGVGVSWFASNGVPYQVQSATSLVTSNWTNLGSQITGNGATNTVFDPFGGVPGKFYQVLTP